MTSADQLEVEMAYIGPEHVTSPKQFWRLEQVLQDNGEVERAVAIGEWRGGGPAHGKCLAIRWNGNDVRPKGNPTSSGQPTWFILHPRHAEALIGALPADKQHIARQWLGL